MLKLKDLHLRDNRDGEGRQEDTRQLLCFE